MLKKFNTVPIPIGCPKNISNLSLIHISNSFKKEHKSIEINIPPKLVDKKIKEIRVIPKSNARFFEIQYAYEVEEVQSNVDKNKALAIDFGINNLATCITSTGKSFIIDGRRLKSINQWHNKENARLQSIKDVYKRQIIEILENYNKITPAKITGVILKFINNILLFSHLSITKNYIFSSS